MDFGTISALVDDRRAALRRDGERIRSARAVRRRRARRSARPRPPADTG